jgi:hypothetical protein
MNYWDALEQTDDQKHWSGWNMRRPARTIKINNYASALVFGLSAFVMLAQYTT